MNNTKIKNKNEKYIKPDVKIIIQNAFNNKS